MSAEVSMRVRLLALSVSMVLLAGCADDRPRGGGRGSDGGVTMGDGGAARCGNGVREGAEACDGLDLGAQSCLSLGLGGGALSCTSSCTLDTVGCDVACTPDCEARQCGFDPACPTASCGECGEGTCDGEGICAVAGPGAPRILSLTSDAPSLVGPGDTFTIVAVVEDPDGLDTITIGRLEGPESEVLGEFVDYGAGRFEFEASLGIFGEVLDLVAPPGGEGLPLRARFYDEDGQDASSSLTITIGCLSQSYCRYECADTQSDPFHCGGCGMECDGTCSFGECSAPDTPAIARYIFEGTCDAGCASAGYECDPGGALGVEDAYGDECIGAAVCLYNYDTGAITVGNCSVPIEALFGVDGGEAVCACREASAE